MNTGQLSNYAPQGTGASLYYPFALTSAQLALFSYGTGAFTANANLTWQYANGSSTNSVASNAVPAGQTTNNTGAVIVSAYASEDERVKQQQSFRFIPGAGTNRFSFNVWNTPTNSLCGPFVNGGVSYWRPRIFIGYSATYGGVTQTWETNPIVAGKVADSSVALSLALRDGTVIAASGNGSFYTAVRGNNNSSSGSPVASVSGSMSIVCS